VHRGRAADVLRHHHECRQGTLQGRGIGSQRTARAGHDGGGRPAQPLRLPRLHRCGVPRIHRQHRARSHAAYSAPIGEGDINFSTTFSYRGKTYQFEIPNPYLDQDGYGLFDASLVYTAPGGRWSLGVHGKNLFDKRYKTSGYTFLRADPVTGELATLPNGQFIPTLGTEGTLTTFYGNPRQVFATATLEF